MDQHGSHISEIFGACLECLSYLKKYLVYLIFQIWTTHIPTFQPLKAAKVLVVPRAGHSFRTDPRLTGEPCLVSQGNQVEPMKLNNVNPGLINHGLLIRGVVLQ